MTTDELTAARAAIAAARERGRHSGRQLALCDVAEAAAGLVEDVEPEWWMGDYCENCDAEADAWYLAQHDANCPRLRDRWVVAYAALAALGGGQ